MLGRVAPVVELGRRSRRGFGAVGAGLATVVLLAGCGGERAPNEPDQAPSSSAEVDAGEGGPFFGECGSVTDEEVRERLAIPAFDIVTRDSVGCVWEVAGQWNPSVTFSWYRGSPIARERAGSELIGRPAEDIEIAGRPGFQGIGYNAQTGAPVLCEIGIDFGADFQHWSVTYGQWPPTADPCEVARELAELSIERAQ